MNAVVAAAAEDMDDAIADVRANSGRIPMTHERCIAANAGKASFDNTTNQLRICSVAGAWITIGSDSVPPNEDGSSAERAGASCLQMSSPEYAFGEQSEDCLFLNVFAPPSSSLKADNLRYKSSES